MDQSRQSTTEARHPAGGNRRRPLLSELMVALGIVQRGVPFLREPTQDFDLPAEKAEVCHILDRLEAIADRVQKAYDFKTGLGLAAPQIGAGRSVAIFRPPDGEQIVLINPIINATALPPKENWSEETEGCLSFFDFRVPVLRPTVLEVRYQDVDGIHTTDIFGPGRLAGDLMHEVDHLNGVLCTSRMPPHERILLAVPEN